jgi:hypothetical protein
MTNPSFIDISEIDFLNLLEKLPADHISHVDYVITSEDNDFFEYGEVPLEKGKRADSCPLHPVTFARAVEKSEFEDRLYFDPEGLLNHLIDAFANDCGPCDIDPETAFDVADSFLCSLPYNTDIDMFLNEINLYRDCDDEMTHDDIRNIVAEKLTANN